MKLTQQELHAKGLELFGPDPLSWKFRCMNCRDEASLQDFIDVGADPGRAGQECIGRSLGALNHPKTNVRGCDFVAYGLIPGPWEIVLPAEGDAPERTMRAFALAAGDDVDRITEPIGSVSGDTAAEQYDAAAEQYDADEALTGGEPR